MSSNVGAVNKCVAIIKRHPVAAYFVLTFTISWIGAFAVAAPYVLRRQPLPKMAGILMFPVMLLGPSLCGILLTRIVDGKAGLRELFSRMFRARMPARWYATLLIFPAMVVAVLLFLERFVSQAYAPNHFVLGILFGIPAGLLEEIGWTGYAFRKMSLARKKLIPCILLGLLWALWHLPVVDFLGAASPHGAYWFPFFLAFTLVMTAVRVLIAWVYMNTGSLMLAQLMHVSSTGSLVVFAPRVTAEQEVIWYALYGTFLWIAAANVARTFEQTVLTPSSSSWCKRSRSLE